MRQALSLPALQTAPYSSIPRAAAYSKIPLFSAARHTNAQNSTFIALRLPR